MSDMQSTDTNRKAQLVAGALVAAFVTAQLFLFLPFTLYAGNSGEFTATFGTILGVYWRIPATLIGVLALVAMLLPRNLYRLYASVLVGIGVLFWIQANLFVRDYGLLDGRSIDWAAGAGWGWVEIGVWVSAIGVSIIGYRTLGQTVIRVAIVLFVFQAGLLAFNWNQQPRLEEQADSASANDASGEIYRFSSRRNVVHIIADGFQSDIFSELINDGDAGNQLRSALDGFTFFSEHMGVFPYTHMTLPAILSGKIYHNDVSIQQHMDSSVGGRTILSVAKDAGHRVDLIVPAGGLANIYKKSDYTNLLPVAGRHHVSDADLELHDAARLIDLSLFRSSPHFLKKYIYNDQLWLIQSMALDRKYMGLTFFSHNAFLRNFTERMSTDQKSGSVYKLIHLILSHNPMVATETCTYAGRVLPTVRETVRNQARCSLHTIVGVLEKMKVLGIYEDATIVLMGDHGAWVPPTRLTAVANADGRTAEMINPAIMALSVPLFAVKRPGDSGPLRVSSAPSWIVDTAATIADAAGLNEEFDGESVFDLEENALRERRHNFYVYKRSEWTDDYLSPIEEFVVRGSVFDSASWDYNVTYHPAGEVERSKVKSELWRTVEID